MQRLFEVEQVLGPEGGSRTAIQRATLRAVPPTLRDVQQSLSPDTAILEYVLDDPASFSLYVTHGRAGVVSLPASRTELNRLVALYRRQVGTRAATIPASRSLYADLIAPLPAQALTPRLIVVPDGRLHLIPFDALVDGTGHYVLETHTITYAPSATVLRLIENAKAVNTNPITFLGVGGVEYRMSVADAARAASRCQTGQRAYRTRLIQRRSRSEICPRAWTKSGQPVRF